MQEQLRVEGLYADVAGRRTRRAFAAFGGEARCLLRMLRGNLMVVEDALAQFKAILEFRQNYRVDSLDPNHALAHECKPFWVAELAGRAAHGSVKGAVIQAAVVRFVRPAQLLERFDQEQLDDFFIHWMELRLKRQRESIAADTESEHRYPNAT